MAYKALEIFNRIIADKGVSDRYSRGKNQAIRACNVTSFFLVLMIIPYIFIFPSLGADLLGYLCIPMVLFYGSVPAINKRGYNDLSRILVAVIGHIIVLFYAVAFGFKSGIYQMFIVTSFYSIMYFDKTERTRQLFSILMTILSVLTFIFFSHIKGVQLFYLKESSYVPLSHLIFLSTLVLILGFIYFFYLTRNRIVGELEDSLHIKEENLILSRERFRILFERTNDAIFLIDLATEVYLDANRAAEDLTGRTVEELKKLTTFDISPRGSRERTEKYLTERKTVDFGEVVYIRPDGSERYAHLSVIPLNEKTVFAFARDITESKKSHELMMQNEKMLSIGGLAAGMAHEINNPLAGMLQTANVMYRRLGVKMNLPKSVEAAEKAGTDIGAISSFMKDRHIDVMLRHIIESGERMSSIVNNMLSFIRNSDGRKHCIELPDLLDSTLELASADYHIREEIDFRKIRIVRDIAPGLPPLRCEKSKIQQVFLNLFRNAADAMQSAGIENPRLTVRMYLETDSHVFAVEVEDNGPGLDEEQKKRIFEPFYTTKPEGKGTGLGLAISYFIICEEHGGEMSVQSVSGSGALFTIRIPLGGDPC